MIVTKDNLNFVLDVLSKNKVFALDTETTGFNAYKENRLFSIIISIESADYYFNFNGNLDHLDNKAPYETVLPKRLIKDIINKINVYGNIIFMHNAKFDLSMLLSEGVEVDSATVICTEVMARLVNNQLPNYKLATLGEIIGEPKDDTVEKYITKHKLYTEVDVGKAKPIKNKHYDLVPFDIISKYGMQDGKTTIKLGSYTVTRLKELSDEQIKLELPALDDITVQEIALTPVLFRMEARGVKIDVAYTQKAYDFETARANEAIAKFEALTEIDFRDSRTVLKKAFDKMGFSYGTTAKGNASFKDDVLPDNTLGNIIRDFRKANKKAGTYYRNFLDLRDCNDVVHCSFRQAGTSTGRMSCSNPNLQNVPKRGEEEYEFKVRKCFVPRDGFFFAMIDFSQMEYRLLMDIAGEQTIIDKINNEGLDVHGAVAEEVDLERDKAKNVNFAILYGSGIAKLASMISSTYDKAKGIRVNYFRTMPAVNRIVSAIKRTAKSRGWITNLFGRRLQCPKGTDYKMVNHYIQGSCGDIVKKGMIQLDEYLLDKESFMILQVHDEVIFEIKYGEEHIIPTLQSIMEDAYNFRTLKLECDAEYSGGNWYDKTKELPKV